MARTRKPMDRRAARRVVREARELKAEAETVLSALDEARAQALEAYAASLAQGREAGPNRESGAPDPQSGLPSGVGSQSGLPTRVRFDVSARPRHQARLLRALGHYERVARLHDQVGPRLEKLIERLDHDLDPSKAAASRLRWAFSGARKRRAAQDSLRTLKRATAKADRDGLEDEVKAALAELRRSKRDKRDPWVEYQKRPVAFNELLFDIGALHADASAETGYLPSEIVENIEAFELDTSLLEVKLRRYQAFGASFALAQKRVILGDEMGLGKTVQALAVIAHLRSAGARHFLVISPASVLANWNREIIRHTEIDDVFVLHGNARDRRLADWEANGGVALTTFGTVGALTMPTVEVSAVVVDEAHYIKNPEAKRTQAVRRWLRAAERVLLMTGTPMENRIDEFENLVDHLNPAVARQMERVYDLGAEAFRRSLASLYLRRNQVDVLDELPGRIEAAEWVTMTPSAARVYNRAVTEGNFMAMRRAAFLTPNPMDSPKMQRLLDLVDEAAENGRKVVVFSYFLDVIDRVATAVGELHAGTLTGETPATDRQAVVDAFSSADGPGVLVAQIDAAGVGLNIQAASVVILTEPQWKPSTEEQAIARCHRMGQLRTVEVHRLLTEDSIDELMVAALADKSALFAEYVRKSALRDASRAAVDGARSTDSGAEFSSANLERQIIEWEQKRLADGPEL